MENKQQWPECVGLDGNSAAEIIKADDPQIHTQVLEQGSMVTMDYRTDRVRIFVDSNGLVVSAPHRG